MNADLQELLKYNAAAPPLPCVHGERQVYFEQELPCIQCYPGAAACVSYPKPDPNANDPWLYYRAVRVLFQRDGDRWAPIPCLARHVDARLDSAIIGAGLEGAFVP